MPCRKPTNSTDETIRPTFAMLVFFIDPMTLVDDKRHLDEVIHDPAGLMAELGSNTRDFPNLVGFIAATDDARTYKAVYIIALDRIIAAIDREIPGRCQ